MNREQRRAASRVHYLAHKAEYIARAALWRERNPAAARAAKKRYRLSHRDQERAKHRRWLKGEAGRAYLLRQRPISAARFRLWKKRNPEKVKEALQRYRWTHKDQIRARRKSKRYRAWRRDWSNRPDVKERLNLYYKRKAVRLVANLHPYYVRTLLSQGSVLPRWAWPQALVELKTANLKLKRLCQHLKTSKNSGTS